MIKAKYCIECGKMDLVFSTFTGEAHWKPMFHICRGPFATIRPPELPENWIDLVIEPSQYEMDIINANASSLRADLGLL